MLWPLMDLGFLVIGLAIRLGPPLSALGSLQGANLRLLFLNIGELAFGEEDIIREVVGKAGFLDIRDSCPQRLLLARSDRCGERLN